MSIRDRLAAVKAALPAVDRLALTDAEAIGLAQEIDIKACRHPAVLEAALAQLAALPPRPDDEDALIRWATDTKAARDAFWDGFEGEVVDGLEIVRKRA